MKLWEEQTELDLFSYRGRIKVSSFRKEDLTDSVHVIYKVEDKSAIAIGTDFCYN